MNNMYELINKLANRLSSLEDVDNVVTLKNKEFEIDGKLFVVTGNINYNSKYDEGDYFTAPYGSREFVSSELEVFFYNEEDDSDVYLNESEINHLYKNI